jgi:putative MATE family efflux protein
MSSRRRSIRKQVIKLAWPAVVQGLLTTVVLFTDRLILGNFNDDALGAMQVCGPVLWCSFQVFASFGVGVLAVVGRGYGAKDVLRVQRTLGTGMAMAVTAGLTLGILGYLGREMIADLITGDTNTPRNIINMATVYMGIVFLAAPLQVLGSTATVSLQALGDTRTPMMVAGISGLTNLGVTWILVFGHFGAPQLGMQGAAIGTAASFALNAILLNCQLLYGSAGYGVRRPSVSTGKQIFRVAQPAFLERLIFHGAYLTFAAFIGHLGGTAMKAHQALMAIESLGFIGAHAFGIAAGALVAQKLGADRPDDARQAGDISAFIGVICLSVVGLILFLFAEPLVAMFSTTPEVISVGSKCLRIAAIAQPLMAITDVYGGALRGAGDTISPMLSAIVGPLLIRLTLCWYLAFHLDWGLVGIWIGSTADWAVRALWLWAVFRRGRWMRLRI